MSRYPMKRMESSLDHGWQRSVRFGKVKTAFWERTVSNGLTTWAFVGSLNNCNKNVQVRILVNCLIDSLTSIFKYGKPHGCPTTRSTGA